MNIRGPQRLFICLIITLGIKCCFDLSLPRKILLGYESSLRFPLGLVSHNYGNPYLQIKLLRDHHIWISKRSRLCLLISVLLFNLYGCKHALSIWLLIVCTFDTFSFFCFFCARSELSFSFKPALYKSSDRFHLFR